MSELPDADDDPAYTLGNSETLDQLADLPPIPTTGRATSRAPMSPRKTTRPASRRTSCAPSEQPHAAATPKPASRRTSRAPSLGPTPSLQPSTVAQPNGRTSRRTSRAPSLGPAVPSSPVRRQVVQEEVVIEETVTRTANIGGTFAVPEEDESSMFYEEHFGIEPMNGGGGLYPDLPQNGGDNDFGM